MSLSLFCLGAGSFSFTMGQSWKPKSSRLKVGRDISPLTQTLPTIDPRRKVVIGEGDDVRVKSQDIFNFSKQAAKSGSRLKNFRTITAEELDQAAVSELAPLYESKTHGVFYSDGVLSIYEKDDKGNFKGEADTYDINGDCRLSWDSGGNPVFTSGSGALTNGRLAATSGNEILIRTTGVTVQAGRGSVVLNLSDARGDFTGGSSVTYLGTYENCTITGFSGNANLAGYFANSQIDAAKSQATFSGVFENSKIEGGLGSDIFSGYFLASTINGGDGTNVFSGMFLKGCEVNGGEEADHFQGRFIDSSVKGNAGNDKFGANASLDDLKLLKTSDDKEYRGLEADFIDSDVDGGEGDDVFDGVAWGTTINLGEGDDRASGVFTQSSVSGGDGNDTLGAMYSLMTSFETGTGQNSVDLGTADTSTVKTDEGASSIRLGHNEDAPVQSGNGYGGDKSLLGTKWQTRDQFIDDPLGESQAVMFGELDNNRIEADKGENEIHVNRGAGTQTILAGSAEAVEKLGKHHQKAPKHEDRERNAPVVSLPLDDAGKLSGLETEAENQAKNAEDQASGRKEQGKEVSRRQARAAADRYAMVFGDTSTATGSAGAVVMTGAGEAITVETNDRFLRTDVENPDLMRNVVQRYDGYGTYKPRAYRVF